MNQEKLTEVNFSQAKRLKRIGFDWQCDKAFGVNRREVNWTTKQFYCWKPTIALAYKFFRKKYGIAPSFYGRSWINGKIAYSIGYMLVYSECPSADLTQYLSSYYEENDGIVSKRGSAEADYDEAEVIALDTMLNFIEINFEEDYDWMKPNGKVKMKHSQKEMTIQEIDDSKKMIKVDDGSGDLFWQYFHKFGKL